MVENVLSGFDVLTDNVAIISKENIYLEKKSEFKCNYIVLMI